jgi:hypothetical protein
MYCNACGTQIPDDSAFCNRCGVDQQLGAGSGTDPPWEICEIKLLTETENRWGEKTYGFCAEAIGAKGVCTAAKTPRVSAFKGNYTWYDSHGWVFDQSTEAMNCLQEFIAFLVRQRREPIGQGSDWYSHRFRRGAK